MSVREATIDELVERYSALLFDAYGVLSYSVGALPGAVSLIDRLNRMGKPYYVLTNDASALPESRAARYRKVGLNVDADRIITSGSLLKGYFAEHGLQDSRCAVLGTEDSAEYVRLAGGDVVPTVNGFDVLVVGDQSGFEFVASVNAVVTELFKKIDAGDLPRLVLPNPDLVYPNDDGFGMASGSVALIIEAALRQRYPERGLEFERLGKPNGAIFEAALRLTGTRDMVMFGDTLETDIRGANAFGIDSVLVAGGVTAFSDQPSAVRCQGRSEMGVDGVEGVLDVPTYWVRSLQDRQD